MLSHFGRSQVAASERGLPARHAARFAGGGDRTSVRTDRMAAVTDLRTERDPLHGAKSRHIPAGSRCTSCLTLPNARESTHCWRLTAPQLR